MIHGFFAMPGAFDDGRRAQDQAAAFLRERFGATATGATATGATGSEATATGAASVGRETGDG